MLGLYINWLITKIEYKEINTVEAVLKYELEIL